ncbi:hypothetical protein [Ensifer sp. YR511]|uniref:hypothetical protein n=1 Tax=Ensifer sp. YR511 TaxID=1855294 RepID=UPI000891D8C6|nr:hypothetical protein [Ensifer sp. YR511]SDN39094.1 hypothetical protein SAMN05216328_12547 [Ensifer sp. YR511]
MFAWRDVGPSLPIAVLLLCAGTAAAQDYPCKPEPQDNLGAYYRKLTIDPDYLVKFQMGQRQFAVPYAYGTGRQTPERINCAPVRNRFEFAFWMPDLRAPKEDSWSKPDWRPQEPGRSRPSDDEYLVKAPFVEEVTSATVPPPRILENLIGIAHGEYRLSFAYDGLIRLSYSDDSEATYFNLEEGHEEVMIRCHATTLAEPACKYKLMFRDLSLVVEGSMPDKNGLSQWRSVKAGIRTLLERWLVK